MPCAQQIDCCDQYILGITPVCPSSGSSGGGGVSPTPAPGPATPSEAGLVKVDCASADPVAVTGWFKADTLAILQSIPTDTCNKIALLTARLVPGDITAKWYYFVIGDVTGEDLVMLSCVVAGDGGGKWVQVP